MDKYLQANRALWDEWTGINYRSEFYNVEAFKADQNRLRKYEIEEIGPVEGKTLLHCSATSASTRCPGPGSARK